MDIFLWILSATFVVSLTSLLGVFTLALSEKRLNQILILLIGFAAGAMIGGAFLHLLPESIEIAEDVDMVFTTLIVGFISFFILEKLLWRHCHERECEIHAFAYLNLYGDGVHNFIDGLVIAAGFLASVELGLITTLAVAAHELPQEIGDFGVLLYGGIEKKNALLLNFATALSAVLGGAVGYFVSSYAGGAMAFLLPFAAGSFIYIAASDLVPELHKEKDTKRVIASFASFLAGILLMWGMRLSFGG